MNELLPEPPFVVLRAARGVPPGWMPAGLEGRWYYRSELERGGQIMPSSPASAGAHAVIVRTTRVEHRDDGASAQVWEVHPPDGNYAND